MSAGSLAAAFHATAERRGDHVLCRFEGTTTTWREALSRARRVAGTLAARGIGRGDRVALAMENRPAFLECYAGVLWAGAAAVPVNPRSSPAELEHVLADADVRLAIADGARARTIAAFAARSSPLPTLDIGDGRADEDVFPDAPLTGDPLARREDVALVLQTSGTTGRSKGVPLTHGNLLASIEGVTDAWEWTAEDALYLTLPLFHMHGLGVGIHGTFRTGSTVELAARFDAGAALDTLAGGAATMFFGVPTMYHRLLAEAEGRGTPPVSRVRLFVSGSAPLRAETLLAFERVFGARILERYGMTETAMLLGNPLHGRRKPGSVGLPFRGVAVRIADRDGRELEEGAPGELEVSGPTVFAGYFRNEEATRAAFTPDGWFRTGDIGRRDADGYVFLTGRAKELIITGGFNVAPREVEEVLEEHPAVAEAAVVGLPDADLGERVAALVVTRAAVSPEEIDAWLTERLSGYKRPRAIHLVEALPRNAMGKVQRAEVRLEIERLEKRAGC